MKTSYRSISLNLDDDLIEVIDEIRIATRGEDIASRSEIVRSLLAIGIASLFSDAEPDRAAPMAVAPSNPYSETIQ